MTDWASVKVCKRTVLPSLPLASTVPVPWLDFLIKTDTLGNGKTWLFNENWHKFKFKSKFSLRLRRCILTNSRPFWLAPPRWTECHWLCNLSEPMLHIKAALVEIPWLMWRNATCQAARPSHCQRSLGLKFKNLSSVRHLSFNFCHSYVLKIPSGWLCLGRTPVSKTSDLAAKLLTLTPVLDRSPSTLEHWTHQCSKNFCTDFAQGFASTWQRVALRLPFPFSWKACHLWQFVPGSGQYFLWWKFIKINLATGQG